MGMGVKSYSCGYIWLLACMCEMIDLGSKAVLMA